AAPAALAPAVEAAGDGASRLEHERQHQLGQAGLALAGRHAMELDEEAVPSRARDARSERGRGDADRGSGGGQGMAGPPRRGEALAPSDDGPLAPGHGKPLRTARAPERPCPPDLRSDRDLVEVAPAPRLAGLERAHDRMLRRPEVRRRVPVLRGIAAADEAAR